MLCVIDSIVALRAGDSSVVMASCHTRPTRSDGLSRWDLNTNGQLRLTGLSSSCLMAAEPSGGLGAFPSLLGGSHGSQAAYVHFILCYL